VVPGVAAPSAGLPVVAADSWGDPASVPPHAVAAISSRKVESDNRCRLGIDDRLAIATRSSRGVIEQDVTVLRQSFRNVRGPAGAFPSAAS